MQVLNDIVGFFTGTLNTVAWLYIFLPFAIIGGVYLTIRTGAVQFSRFGYMLRNTVGKMFRSAKAGAGEVTPLQAVTTALAATVGTGNIVGTSQAIALGGYGAVFWLWIAALVGMVTKYSEVTLAVKYRERDDKGDWVGGPMYYIKNGMGKGWGWLAILFSLFAALASFGIGNMSQVNSITGSVIGAVQQFTTVPEETAVIMRWVIGGVLAVLIGVILIGGIKRIGSVTEKLIPFMSLLYIIFTLVVIFGNIGSIGDAFGKIFSTAFTPQAMFGASTGIVLRETIVWGLRRSAFSNEAGLGSAAIAHAATSEKDPVKQGLYGIFEVFADTIVICTLTALTIIISGVDISFGVKPGSELIVSAFATVFGGKIAAVFVAVALMLFAFSTVLGWALYGTRCVQYLFGTKAILWYRILFVAVAVVGCVTSIDVVWDVADTFNGLMAIPNFIAVFALSGVVAKLTRDHFRAEKELRK
ncbi:MAG: sodium:alanine symporter family protein [Oscillospiraceae bacterium]|nr:sodium:alanine symporter family protein [Oscillospiraceae bacterium]MBR3860390.1 sodium:alanine symporter family protein [Oscillospiraceae bacterium]MBR6095623.1 sodium:alanine symporter family protein [Oscillospiraceae bacterium]